MQLKKGAQKQQDKQAEQERNNYLRLYVNLTILEERIEGNWPASEGVRIVKELQAGGQ
jgi:hypothetical protein